MVLNRVSALGICLYYHRSTVPKTDPSALNDTSMLQQETGVSETGRVGIWPQPASGWKLPFPMTERTLDCEEITEEPHARVHVCLTRPREAGAAKDMLCLEASSHAWAPSRLAMESSC